MSADECVHRKDGYLLLERNIAIRNFLIVACRMEISTADFFAYLLTREVREKLLTQKKKGSQIGQINK